MPKIIKRSLGARLSQLVQSRGVNPTTRTGPTTVGRLRQDDSLVSLDEDALPLTEILSKTRKQGRAARDNDFMHVSDLIGKCVRKVVLIERMGMSAPTQGISFFDDVAFAQGNAIHDLVKKRAADGSPQLVWGLWRCHCGLTSTKSPSLLSELENSPACTFCHERLSIYKELPVRNNEYKIVGNPDLITYLPAHEALHVNELKSISHDAWKELSRPIPEHIIQTIFYWSLLKDLKYRLTDRVSILYVTKGWLFSGSPYKEFTVNAPENLMRLGQLKRDALDVKQAREGGKLPARICSSQDVTQAKNCEVCRTCFGATDETPVKISVASALKRDPKATGTRYRD